MKKIINISEYTQDFAKSANLRVTLTTSQYDAFIASKTDVSSKMGKTIGQNKKLFRLLRYVLDDFCNRSNGGCVSVGINQKALCNSKLPNGDTINKDTLTKVMKNLLQYQMIEKVSDYQIGVSSTTYRLGSYIMQLLDPIKLKSFKDKVRNIGKLKSYIDIGIDPNTSLICPCCREEKHSHDFAIDKESEILKPVCKNCCDNKIKKGITPNGWREAWNVFFNEKNQIIAGMEVISAKVAKELNNEILDNEVDKLLAL